MSVHQMPKGPVRISRQLNFLKCDFCRRDKQKCLPQVRDWPMRKCDRCIEKSLPCSSNRRSRGRARLSNQLKPGSLSPPENGTANSIGGQNPRLPSAVIPPSPKSKVQCLQEVGDLRHLLDCWKIFNFARPCNFPVTHPLMEVKELEQLLESILTNALWHIGSHAGQLESNNQYADAEYLYQCAANSSDRRNKYRQMSSEGLERLLGLYEKMPDFPLAEDVQEIILASHIWIAESFQQQELRNRLNLTRLYGLFHDRIVAMGIIDAEHIAKTSILYRSVALDNVSLYTNLLVGGLIPQHLDLFGRPPLHITVQMNAVRIARHLLDSQPEVNVEDGFGQTALLIASRQSCMGMVQLLLAYGADVDAVDNGDGKSALIWAAAAGDAELVRLLLLADANINHRPNNDMEELNAFEEAVKSGHSAVVQLLLENGADAVRYSNRSRAIYIAFQRGDEKIAQMLLDGGSLAATGSVSCILEPGDDGRLLLLKTVEGGQLPMIKLLVKYGININAKNYGIETNSEYNTLGGMALLDCAAATGDSTVVTLLLEAGADINAKVLGAGRRSTALEYAIENGHTVVVELLLEKGAKHKTKDSIFRNTTPYVTVDRENSGITKALLEARDQDGQTALHDAVNSGHEDILGVLLEVGVDTETVDQNGLTPLLLAVKKGKDGAAWLLLENGADIEAADKEGRTPLRLAAGNGNKEVVQLLLEKGADIEAADEEGWTPLLLAVLNENKEVAQLLLEKGADIEAADEDGQTPLLLAVLNENKEVVQLLLEKGADIEAADEDGQTPLLLAAWSKNKEVVQLLLENGADIEAADEVGWTSLLQAAWNGNKEVVQLLLENGADIEDASKEGWTPLLLAARNENKEVVQLLLEKGADIEARNVDGWTALIMAMKKKNQAVVKMLLENGADIEARDEVGKTVLHLAALEGDKDMMELLLKYALERN